jgi:hypothetical protein|tara:strand:- start:1081 stop:1254 length:174 start_codon:yes stop_codon:yes gene_type:complete
MIIEVKATDEDGIVTSITIDENVYDDEGLENIFKKFTIFMIKNGADLPEEITDFLDA